jgi:hypothetical protein
MRSAEASYRVEESPLTASAVRAGVRLLGQTDLESAVLRSDTIGIVPLDVDGLPVRGKAEDQLEI